MSYWLYGCQTEYKTAKSPFFQTIIGDTSGVYRGVELGVNPTTIKTKEKISLRIEDSLGLAYFWPMKDAGKLEVEYYFKNNRMEGIIANVRSEDEKKMRLLMEELVDFYVQKFNKSPDGSPGFYKWDNKNYVLTLKLTSNKKALTLNVYHL